MVPWLICETFFGMLVSWACIFASLTVGLHRNLDAPIDIPITIGYWVVSFVVNFFITKEIAFAYKISVSQKLELKR